MLNFKGRHFEKIIILQSIRWYCAYGLSYRDIEELMAERGIHVDHSTINRWVMRYAPELEQKFRRKHKRSVGSSWRADETYIKIKGVWHYLYRAVDKSGATIDFLLTKKRNKAAALQFFKKSIKHCGLPKKVAIDKSPSNNKALKHIKVNLTQAKQFLIRQVKYLNNIVEQDHRFIKKRVRPTLGFKSFSSAQSTIAGIELHHMLRKNQHQSREKMTIFQQFYNLAA